MICRGNSAADAVAAEQHTVFAAAGTLILYRGIVPGEAGIQPDLGRQQELSVLAVSGAGGVDLGKAPDVVAGKIAGMLTAFGVGRRVDRYVGPLGPMTVLPSLSTP